MFHVKQIKKNKE